MDPRANTIKSDVTRYINPKPKLRNTFTNKVNGLVTKLDSIQNFGIFDNGLNASGLAISNGGLVHGNPTNSNAAGYLEVILDNKVTRMGATVKFPATNPGSVALVSFQQSIVEEKAAGHAIPNAGIHVKIDTTKVEVIVYLTGGGSTPLGIYNFTTALSADTEYNFEVVRNSNTVYAILPDGTVTPPYTNTNIDTYTSKYATFELFESTNTKNPATITKIWADDSTIEPNTNIVSKIDISKALSKIPEQVTHLIDKTSASTITLTTNYQTILSVPVNTPVSKKAIVIASAFGNITSAGLMFFRVSNQANLTYGWEQAVGSSVQDGVFTVFGMVTFATDPGVSTNVTLEAKMISGTGSVVTNNSTGRPVTVTVIPIT